MKFIGIFYIIYFIVYFGLIFVQSQDRLTYQVTPSKVDGRGEIQKNFQNLFNAIVRNDTGRSEIHSEILNQEVIREGQPFDTMKEELQIAQARNAYKKRKFYNGRNNANENIVAVKRETNGSSPSSTGRTSSNPTQTSVRPTIGNLSSLNPKQMRELEKLEEEAAKRDHRKIGQNQELFFFHELSPGSCFFTPRGAFIYNTLVDYIKTLYRKRGYQEVITPEIYNVKLWQTSGHWEHFAENMFSFGLNESNFALKPMNCPGHCLIFGIRNRSWRELPLRLADFGVLHRHELSGVLSGLTRVRRFQQDDAHIFCETKQLQQEVTSVLDFLKEVYTTLGFTFQCNLATRPKKFMGDPALWDDAERQLEQSLNAFGAEWRTEAGDGAFYGPKIDITIRDALNQSHQCATIQLDFQLPIRFNLEYADENHRLSKPLIIHRAILGSVERMIAILTESYAGKWPFWLSPRQAIVIPIDPVFNEYATAVRDRIFEAGFQCDADTYTSDRFNKKIRNAQIEQYNFILVVGEKEKSTGSVNVRTRDVVVHGQFKVEDVIQRFEKLKRSRSLKSDKEF